MITFPNAKINLGLNITEKRSDGYHNLETIFYPIKLEDALEISEKRQNNNEYNLYISGVQLDGSSDDNLVVRAYNLLKKEFILPPIDIYLHKHIPSGAGLGGGSSDAAFMLKLLNKKYELGLSDDSLKEYAATLGADCAFFIENKPVFATGIGNIFSPIKLDLSNYYIAVIKPDIFVSTREAFAMMQPRKPEISLTKVIESPISEWKELMVNDFEKTVFAHHPEIKTIKEQLYESGSIYASMSGSGSSVFGIFEVMPTFNTNHFSDCFIWSNKL